MWVVFRVMQIKTTISYYTSIRTAKKVVVTSNADENTEKLNYSYIADENVK